MNIEFHSKSTVVRYRRLRSQYEAYRSDSRLRLGTSGIPIPRGAPARSERILPDSEQFAHGPLFATPWQTPLSPGCALWGHPIDRVPFPAGIGVVEQGSPWCVPPPPGHTGQGVLRGKTFFFVETDRSRHDARKMMEFGSPCAGHLLMTPVMSFNPCSSDL